MNAVERRTFRGDGLDIVGDVVGDPDAPRVIFLHGGGQTRHSWKNAAKSAAAAGYLAISLDLRGHGDSDWDKDGDYALARHVADVLAVIDQIGGKPVLVGASLGGMASMFLASAHPDRISGLVLVDITPRIEPEGQQEIGAFMNSAPNGFASPEEAADAVAAYLPHRKRPSDTSGLMRNLRLRDDGRYHWHWDPKLIGPREGKEPVRDPAALEAAARNLKVPTLLLRGGLSRIVSPEGVREFLEMAPHAEYRDIAGADHMVAGDKNDLFNEAVLDFLGRILAKQPT